MVDNNIKLMEEQLKIFYVINSSIYHITFNRLFKSKKRKMKKIKETKISSFASTLVFSRINLIAFFISVSVLIGAFAAAIAIFIFFFAVAPPFRSLDAMSTVLVWQA